MKEGEKKISRDCEFFYYLSKNSLYNLYFFSVLIVFEISDYTNNKNNNNNKEKKKEEKKNQ